MTQPALIETERLILRPWTTSEADRSYFHYLNSDDAVMRYFPFRRERRQSDETLQKIITATTADGLGWLATCLKGTGKPIGFAGLSKVSFSARFTPATEIGWRLGQAHWRKGFATEAAKALLSHGFVKLELGEIVSFAVHDNHPSTAVMKRIGMTADPAFDFDHPDIGDAYPRLKRHVFYRLSRERWLQRQGAVR